MIERASPEFDDLGSTVEMRRSFGKALPETRALSGNGTNKAGETQQEPDMGESMNRPPTVPLWGLLRGKSAEGVDPTTTPTPPGFGADVQALRETTTKHPSIGHTFQLLGNTCP